jgi:arylsulfatase
MAQAPAADPLARFGPRAPVGASNIVIILLDDVGFGATSAFGGPVPTPTLDALAKSGLRYNRFHTTAICSPTRASLLTGRNPHATGIGAVMNSVDDRPGYSGFHGKDTASIGVVLRQNGYSTAAFGKWHQTPDWEVSPVGPFDRWPTGEGFDTFRSAYEKFCDTALELKTPVGKVRGTYYVKPGFEKKFRANVEAFKRAEAKEGTHKPRAEAGGQVQAQGVRARSGTLLQQARTARH